jgi:outer membrane protein
MKKLLILWVFLAATASTGLYAQRTAVVDVNEILSNMPDYKTAQDQLDQIAEKWRQQIAQEMDQIKSMYNKYQAEQVLLSEDMKRQKEDEIMNKEKEVRELQRQKFGPEGQLFQKRQELVAPIQNEVFKAVQGFADSRGFDIILDKSSTTGILFLNDEFDKTDDVKRILGIK